MPATETPNPRRILRLPAVMETVGLRRTAIYDLIQAGEFPKPIRLSPRAVGWRVEEIDAWLADRPRAA